MPPFIAETAQETHFAFGLHHRRTYPANIIGVFRELEHSSDDEDDEGRGRVPEPTGGVLIPV